MVMLAQHNHEEALKMFDKALQVDEIQRKRIIVRESTVLSVTVYVLKTHLEPVTYLSCVN